jgi:VIT1/CCC1 family predicted Fe2+/Mn2+ transporter
MEAGVTPAPQSRRWSLKKLYITTVGIIAALVLGAPSFYNSDILLPLALVLLAALLLLGALALGLFEKNLLLRQLRRSVAWLLLACLNFAGWWVSYRISVAAIQLPLSPDDSALGDLLRWAFAPYFSS